MAVAGTALLHGCAWEWNERDMAMLSTGFLDWTGVPIAAAGPQPFGSRDGQCYYVYRTEVRDLGDDTLVACVAPTGDNRLSRAVMLDDRGVLALAMSPSSIQRTRWLAWNCDLVTIRDSAQVEALCPGQAPVTELSCTAPSERVVVALQTRDSEGHRDSVIADCDARDGTELLRQKWEIRDLCGLDSTSDGDVFVCAGSVDGVQGVYLGLASTQAVPALIARNAQYPSISADGASIAMTPYDSTRTWTRAMFKKQSSVNIVSTSTGATQEVAIAPDSIVCGTRYVENPTRLLVFGMRSEADGKAVWWVIWTIGSDGVASELRTWRCARGEVVL